MITRATIRAFATAGLKVVNDVVRQQFVVNLKGSEATLEYVETKKIITFVSTNVPKVFQGKGVAKLLAKHAFDYAQEKGLDVYCECEYLVDYYNKNKNQYKSLKFHPI